MHVDLKLYSKFLYELDKLRLAWWINNSFTLFSTGACNFIMFENIFAELSIVHLINNYFSSCSPWNKNLRFSNWNQKNCTIWKLKTKWFKRNDGIPHNITRYFTVKSIHPQMQSYDFKDILDHVKSWIFRSNVLIHTCLRFEMHKQVVDTANIKLKVTVLCFSCLCANWLMFRVLHSYIYKWVYFSSAHVSHGEHSFIHDTSASWWKQLKYVVTFILQFESVEFLITPFWLKYHFLSFSLRFLWQTVWTVLRRPISYNIEHLGKDS